MSSTPGAELGKTVRRTREPVVFHIAKAFGDDRMSWCVFQEGAPVMCGLSRREAQYHRDRMRELAGVK